MESKGQIPKKDYFRVKNDWWDALIKTRMSGRERQCLDYIIRRTYGWQKREDQISISDFVDATGILKSHVSAALKSLKDRQIIIVTKNGNYRWLTYQFNKYYSQWLPKTVTEKELPKTVTKSYRKRELEVTENGNSHLLYKEQLNNSLEDNNIDNPKKRIVTPSFSSDSIPYLLSQTLFNRIILNLPDFGPNRNGHREKTIQNWAVDIDKMIRLDKRNPCHIWNMILWIQDTETEVGEFWFKNILSGKKLRLQYDKLSANITAEMRKRERNKPQHERLLEVGRKWLEKQKDEMNDF